MCLFIGACLLVGLTHCSSGKNHWTTSEVQEFEQRCTERFENQRVGTIYFTETETEQFCDCLSSKMSERASYSDWRRDSERYLDDMTEDGTLQACLFDAAQANHRISSK